MTSLSVADVLEVSVPVCHQSLAEQNGASFPTAPIRCMLAPIFGYYGKSMVGRRQYIHQLEKKLESLVRETPNHTWLELEELARIRHATFDQACDRDHAAYSKLGIGHQNKLAHAFGFLVAWPEWHDPERLDGDTSERSGIDSARAFAKKLAEVRRKAQIKGHDTDNATATCSFVDKEVTRRIDAELMPGPSRPASTPLGTMAQVILGPGQSVGAGAHQVVVELSCHTTNIIGSNSRFSVRRALLAIDCKDGRGRRDAIAGLAGGPITLSNSNGESATFAWVGSTKMLRWDATANGAMIGHLWFDAGVVEELAHGDVLRVSLTAWLKDIDTTDGGYESVFGIISPKKGLLEQPAESLTIEQQRLIAHLNKLKLPVDANGYAEIASHELEVVRKA